MEDNKEIEIDQEYVEPAGWKQYAGQYSSYWEQRCVYLTYPYKFAWPPVDNYVYKSLYLPYKKHPQSLQQNELRNVSGS